MPNHPLANELSLIESLTKVFAAALGILYLLGFLVVASHLSRFGVSSFSVLQLQYLIAGFWVLGPPAVHASLVYASRKFDERAAPATPGKFNWRGFAFSLLLTGVPTLIFFVLLFSIPNVIENVTWGIGVRVYLFYIAVVNLAWMFWTAWRTPAEKETWLMSRSHAAPFYLTALSMIVLGYAVWFSVRIYPLIPFSLGGGRPLTIVFIEGEKKMPDEIEKAGPSAKRSVPYKLLLSTDRYYVVVSPSPKERSMEVSRDSVAGMIVLQ
jgi:hypothetical protein